MKKIRTISMLQDFLDAEFAWRIKEIADIKFALRASDATRQKTLTRSSVPLLYAHWEGFVKGSSLYYINFVNNQRLRYEQLTSCFIVFGLKKKLNQLSQSKKSHLNIAAVDFLLNELRNQAKLQIDNAIDTEANLSSIVFENIALSIGIDPTPYQTRYNLIDESLLRRRNQIAHGQYLDLEPNDCRTLADDVVNLMRHYKTDLENAATIAAYKR
jgi:hypothetical protein